MAMATIAALLVGLAGLLWRRSVLSHRRDADIGAVHTERRRAVVQVFRDASYVPRTVAQIASAVTSDVATAEIILKQLRREGVVLESNGLWWLVGPFQS